MECPLKKPECEEKNCAWPILEKEKCRLHGLILLFLKALREEKKDGKRQKTIEKKKPEKEKEWLRTGEAAEFLGIHPNTIREWAAKGILKAHRLPGPRKDRRFSRTDLKKIMGIKKTKK